MNNEPAPSHPFLATKFNRYFQSVNRFLRGLSQWLTGKESACNAGDSGLIPGSERPIGEGIGYPLQWEVQEDFPCGSAGEESSCNPGDLSSIPGLGRSPGEGNGSPLQYSCLQNPHGQRSLAGYSPWSLKESDMIE